MRHADWGELVASVRRAMPGRGTGRPVHQLGSRRYLPRSVCFRPQQLSGMNDVAELGWGRPGWFPVNHTMAITAQER